SLTLAKLMDNPPYFIGYGFEVTGASDYYVVGSAHEHYLGDVNGDGILAWLAFYFDMGLSVNGLDDDGDGCVDESSSLTPDGQTCDNIPDAVVFLGVGGAGNIVGDLIVYYDWFNEFLGFHRIGSSPLWIRQGIRIGMIFFPQLVGEFVTYYALESDAMVNVNKAIGDKDYDDWFVGIVDARGFPSRPPRNHPCRTGHPTYSGYGFQRQDGSIVVGFELREYFDEAPGYDNDYNDDGDTKDSVVGYFIVNPNSGRCKRFVNTGVEGRFVENAGNIIAAGLSHENADQRDWNNDGDTSDYVSLYHDVTSSERLAGNPYFGYTFKTPVPRGPAGQLDSYGFGFTGLYLSQHIGPHTFPMEFGGSYELYTGYPVYYETYYWHVLDEDGLQWTELPGHYVSPGMPFDSPGGICVAVANYESRLDVDINGDGDKGDSAMAFFCPDPNTPGTGTWQEEPASGQSPWVAAGTIYYYYSAGGKNLITFPFSDRETATPPGGGDPIPVYVSRNWHFNKVDPDFQILNAQWVGDPRVQLGGSISGFIDVENIWDVPILCFARLENDQGWEMRNDGCVENTERDGILRSGQTARIHFTLFAPGKGKTGPYTLTIDLTLQRIIRSVQLLVELYR
ncbi:MAG: hypothetical protein V3U09_08675, partial [Thermoplasmata archaeon]